MAGGWERFAVREWPLDEPVAVVAYGVNTDYGDPIREPGIVMASPADLQLYFHRMALPKDGDCETHVFAHCNCKTHAKRVHSPDAND